MKHLTGIVSLASIMMLSFNSCKEEDESLEEIGNNHIAFQIVPFESADITRTSIEINALTGPIITWTEGDTLGVFPVNGYPTDFAINNGIGGNTAIFDGGGWALRSNESYAAYYPFSCRNQNRKSIPITYIGQKQRGNASTLHLSAFDYMKSQFTEVNDKGNVNFAMQHLGAIIAIEFTVAEVDLFSKLEIIAPTESFVNRATFDIDATSSSLNPERTDDRITLNLVDIATTENDQTITLYVMIAPTDLQGAKLKFKLVGKSQKLIAEADGRNFLAGKAYKFKLDGKEYVIDPSAIDLGTEVNGKKILWANKNLGANTPEAFGFYYAWGETVPYGKPHITDGQSDDSQKIYYDWNTYQFCKGTPKTLTKYLTSDQSEFYSDNNYYDNKMTLDSEDDAAQTAWGDQWRIPTDEEFAALRTQCKWTWNYYEGTYGYTITGNGQSIFLPAAGYYRFGNLNASGTYGFYWSTSLCESSPSQAVILGFGSNNYYRSYDLRALGQTIRPVYVEK